eukprot:scaffold484_cov34-Attheya_sp.AAC.2
MIMGLMFYPAWRGGGFAREGSITPEEYKAASPDKISEFGVHVASHMNDDHHESTIGIIESQVPGINASEAVITSVDSTGGIFVKVTRSPVGSEEKQTFKMRLPFPREAKDRNDVKAIMVARMVASSSEAYFQKLKQTNTSTTKHTGSN